MADERPASAAPRQTFSKKERLCAKKDITLLLNKGRYFSVDGIFRVCILERKEGMETAETTISAAPKARLLISVPKRHFKRAVRRNLLKRRIREAYRRNKPESPVDVMVIYLPAEILEYAPIEAAMREVVARIDERGNRTADPRTEQP
ncbi:MAG: ribonuclease P protein component [Bacteroidales bacterium]|nr:ribonuclease P protein component [Bacteroidales bacterium]